MTAGSSQPAEFESAEWKTVRLGLRLAINNLGAGAIVCFYALWGVIGVILSFVLIPMAIGGKTKAFDDALSPVALYGLVWPMALMSAATWAVQLFARLLWCRIPTPRTAAWLAYGSAAGRLAILVAVGCIGFSGVSLENWFLLPGIIAASAIAALGLVAEWVFLRTLQRTFNPAPDPTLSAETLNSERDGPAESVDATEQNQKGILTRDIGEWFKERFPRGHKVVGRILLPTALIAWIAFSALDQSDPFQTFLDTLFRIAIGAPVFFQVFGLYWLPHEAIHGLIGAISPKTGTTMPSP